MTPESAVKLGDELLAHLGIDGWSVNTLPFIPENPRYAGLCCYGEKIVWLSETQGGLCIDIIVHEIAHVLTPYCDDYHGAAWLAAKDRIAPLAELLAAGIQ